MAYDVLLVDDDPDLLEAIKNRLELEGFKLRTRRSFIEAIDYLKPTFPGVVVTDLRMPGKCGLELIRRARAIDPELPVIMLTGFAETEVVVHAMRSGAATVLEKPCSIARLTEEILKAGERRQAVLRARQRKAQDAARSPSGKAPKELALSPQVAEFERQLIRKALSRNQGDKVTTAKELGLSRSTLYAKIKHLKP